MTKTLSRRPGGIDVTLEGNLVMWRLSQIFTNVIGTSLPKKIAESTGRLPISEVVSSRLKATRIKRCVPPTPMPRTPINDAIVTRFLDPPAASPNTPAMNNVALKGHLGSGGQWGYRRVSDGTEITDRRPQMSLAKPQETAPTKKPILAARVRKGPLK